MNEDLRLIADDNQRPGLRARTVRQLAHDLMLARDQEPASTEQLPRLDVGESSGRRGRAIFLLGAGCSFSAGIPLASEVAKRCACLLERRYGIGDRATDGSADADASLAELITRGLVPSHFLLAGEKGDWGELYKYFFAEHLKSPNQQREIISKIIGEDEFALNWAHACLGALVQRRYVHTVLTTNFDQLALQGIIRTGITPVVADGLESLVRISPSPARPQVVHLHGSMHTYDLRNSPAAITETENDPNLQTMMMSLLKHSTMLVVVGYAGGEEGVMSLLQHAAQNIPRMVVYWITFEKSYRDLSSRARTLVETGENKFFIPDQDADRFFQRLMRDLNIGQPDWVANPIDSLVEQGHKFKGSRDDEISELIEGYQSRVTYAHKNRLRGDEELVEALQARSAGKFDLAIKLLQPMREHSRHHRKLYAQSLQDAFDVDPVGNSDRIDEAIAEFEHLYSKGRPFRFGDAEALIEALFDRLDTQPDTSSVADDEQRLRRIVEIIKAARKHLKRESRRERALLEFYQARATQELFDKTRGRGRDVIDAYRRAVTAPDDLGDKIDEARDGLAQALVTYTDTEMNASGSTTARARRTMREDMDRAIAIHTDLVELAWLNHSTATFAARLENLASDFEVLAKVRRQAVQKETALLEAIVALERAAAAYGLGGDTDRVAAAEARIAELRQKLRDQ